MVKTEIAPRAKQMLAARAHKCGAKARQNRHQPCRQPAMKNGRCRLHGGKSTGPRTEKGKQKAAHANLKHGMYTKDALLERLKFQLLMSWIKDQD